MGIGDQIIGTGMARGAHDRGKRVAFGDGRKILWDGNSALIFRHNPNIAPPGSEVAPDLEWVKFYKGHRQYNRDGGDRWIWNYDFRPVPGEVWLDREELLFAEMAGRGLVVIEPNVPHWKSVAPNKQWPIERYQTVADRLVADGYPVAQFIHPGAARKLRGVAHVTTPTFRHAIAVLARARLFIGSEGGLHHAAAADKRSLDGKLVATATSAVVLFGGFVPPQVTGYRMHVNLTGGAEACGSYGPCKHCFTAMMAIAVDDVYAAAVNILEAQRGETVRNEGPAERRGTEVARRSVSGERRSVLS